MKNKFLGSVFNITTTVMSIVLVSVSLMAGIGVEEGRELICTLRPFLTWTSHGAIIIVGFLSLLYKDVMVSNAHQDTEPEAKKLFDVGYLAAVSGFLFIPVVMPVVQYTIHGIETIALCLGEEEKIDSDLLKISTASIVLIFTFTVLISLRTLRNVKKLEDWALPNLPASNALTFVDTLILCFLSYANFLVQRVLLSVFMLDLLSYEVLAFWINFLEFFIQNVIISFLFPIYIILKTRRYLPRLWSDDSPLILQNNDFYAVRLSQVSPSQQASQNIPVAELAETWF